MLIVATKFTYYYNNYIEKNTLIEMVARLWGKNVENIHFLINKYSIEKVYNQQIANETGF